jgi:hypothetical protein
MRGCSLLPKGEDGKSEISSPSQMSPTKSQVQEEIDDEASMCIVCFADKKDTLFYKCGHVGMLCYLFNFNFYSSKPSYIASNSDNQVFQK